MAVVDSAIYEEVVAQISAIARPASYKLKLDIIVDGLILESIKVIAEDGTRNFENSYADSIVVTAQFLVSTFERYIYNNRTKLKATIRAIPIGESTDAENLASSILERQYSAILVETRDFSLQGLPNYNGDLGIGEFQFQLVNPAIEQFRLMTGGSCFHKQNPGQVVKGLLTYLSQQIKVPDKYQIKGVELWPPDNQDVLKHVIVPATTPAPDIPGYIQKYAGGVYNHGIGYFLYMNIWYVYPLYDHTRYERAKTTLDLFIIPKNRSTGSTRTFQYREGRLQVLITGDVRHKDSTDLQHLNAGNGVRFMKASPTFNQFAEVKGNRAFTNTDKTTAQFLINKREGINQSVRLSDNPITDNVCYEMSKLAARNGQIMVLVWENSRPDLLLPGMPLRIYYGAEKGYSTLTGTLLNVTYVTQLDSPGVTNERYRTSTALYVFVNPPSPSKA